MYHGIYPAILWCDIPCYMIWYILCYVSYNVPYYTTCYANPVVVISVGSLNNDRTVMSRPYAWRPLACLPILKGGSFPNTDVEWQRRRRLSVYHSAMEHIVDDVNEICSTDRHYRFADKVVRCGRGFWHFLSIDGAEIACATLCDTHNCPTCECPREDLDSTTTTYPIRKTSWAGSWQEWWNLVWARNSLSYPAVHHVRT